MIIHRLSRATARVLAAPVRLWRLVSQYLPNRCRFYPSCSAYALGALETHGPIRGSWLALRRVGRCHPWHEGGLDPVPYSSRATSSGRVIPPSTSADLDRMTRVVS